MNISRAIQYLFPQAVIREDFLVGDDGEGPYLAVWNLPQSRPSEKQLTEAWAIASLADAQADGLRRIGEYAKAKRGQIAGTNDNAELAGWVNKLRIAQAIAGGTASDYDKEVIQAEVIARSIAGETLDGLVGKVLRNGAFFSKASALIDGIKRRGEDAVKAAQTPDEVAGALAEIQKTVEAAFAERMKG